MDFIVKKCKIMRITKKKEPFASNFFSNNSVLEEVNEFQDLGITTDQHLRWNLHIHEVVAKANRMLRLIKRTCRDFDDRKNVRTLYSTLVRVQFRILLSYMVPLHQKRALKSWRKFKNGQLNLS